MTLGAIDGGKPPRFGAAKQAAEPEIDLTLSNKANFRDGDQNRQAFLPQSLKAAGSGEAEVPTESDTLDSKQPYQ